MATTGRKANPPGMGSSQSHESKAKQAQRRAIAENLGPYLGSLPCPEDMSPYAKKEWRRIMREYAKMPAQVLTKLDIMPLRQYCELAAQYHEAEQKWINDLKCSVVSTDPTTQKVIDTIRATMIAAATAMRPIAEQLLLTPTGRAKMGVNPATPKDPAEQLAMILGGASLPQPKKGGSDA